MRLRRTSRGNDRHDVFGSVGAAQAFERTLAEASELHHHWRVHACVVMRNHFHVSLETPDPNLVEGMHGLQGTFAARFNRFRGVRGHLFQRRCQARLVEDEAGKKISPAMRKALDGKSVWRVACVSRRVHLIAGSPTNSTWAAPPPFAYTCREEISL